MAKMTTLLRHVTDNPAALDIFNVNPRAAMIAARLSRKQKELIRGRRVLKLGRAVQVENITSKEPVVCVVLIKPRPGFWDMSDENLPFTTVKGSKSAQKRRPAKSKRGSTKG
jgi:hypothetical protein